MMRTLVLLSMCLLSPLLVAADPRPSVMLTAERIALLRQRIETKTEPTARAWTTVLGNATAAIGVEPKVPKVWFVPSFYGQSEAHKKAKQTLQDSANSAYALALAWQMTKEVRYAEASARIILAWAALTELKHEADSELSFCYHFPPLIFAADLLRGSPAWPAQAEQTFTTFLRDKALPMNTMKSGNNWGNWGLVLYTAIAAYTADTAGLDTAEARWKQFIDTQMDPDGKMHGEVKRNNGRSGLWYSNFSLLPQTIAGEILRVQGRDVFPYVGKGGRTLRLAYDRIAPWNLRPETFPYYKGDPKELHGNTAISYFEILLPRWPNANAQTQVGSLRPLTSKHGLPFLTFTHGEAFAQPKP